MFVNTNTQVNFKTIGDWGGNIIADAPGGEAVFWQGGYIYKKSGGVYSPYAHFGYRVAEGPGFKSASSYVTTFTTTNSGSGSYKMGSEFQADSFNTIIPGNNDVDFYSGSNFVKTDAVRIEYPAGTGC